MYSTRFVGGDGIHQSAIHFADFKGDVGDALRLVALAHLNEFETAHPLVIKGELLALGALLDQYGLRCAVQHKLAAGHLDFLGGDCSAGSEAGEQDAAIFVGHILTIVGAKGRPGTVGDQEGRSSQRLSAVARGVGIFNVLLDRQICSRRVVDLNGLGVRRIDRDHLPLCPGVNGVPRQGLGLLDDDRPHNRNPDFPVLVRGVEAQGGEVAVIIVHILPGGVA